MPVPTGIVPGDADGKMVESIVGHNSPKRTLAYSAMSSQEKRSGPPHRFIKSMIKGNFDETALPLRGRPDDRNGSSF